MTRDYEEHASRRRHQAATNISFALIGAILYFLINPSWVGEDREATKWLLRFTGAIALVAIAGITLQVRRHRRRSQLKLESDLGLPPTTADAPQQLPRER